MLDLQAYVAEQLARAQVEGKDAILFAKVLTLNDDSGRHGVLIPSEAYDFFPAFSIPHPSVNDTMAFDAFHSNRARYGSVGYKYYQRYPERRLTRLHRNLNGAEHQRLLIVVKVTTPSGLPVFIVDTATDGTDGRFAALWRILAGPSIPPSPGKFVTVPLDFKGIEIDSALGSLLEKFDALKGRWIESLRTDDTGIGYTFESLLGIEENNSKLADFQGIEIKCKRSKEHRASASGKLNLFQQGPVWASAMSGIERLRVLGQLNKEGQLACHSQVNTSPNNLGLSIWPSPLELKILLRKNSLELGHWDFAILAKRLREKHSRAVLIKAQCRTAKGRESFLFDEVIYCEKPSIERFMDLVKENKLVFEFLLAQRGMSVRNRGYPWRLLSEALLERLFLLVIKLR